jgi:hypothetical protein
MALEWGTFETLAAVLCQVIIRYRTGSVALRWGSRRPTRLFESALESHEKILKPPWN